GMFWRFFTHFAADAVSDFSDGVTDQAGGLWIGRNQLGANRRRRTVEQLQEIMTGDVGACSDCVRQYKVALRALDQLTKPGMREAGPAIVGDRAHHTLVASLDKDVGDSLAQRCALRNGVEVALALGPRVLNKIFLTQPR